MASRSVLLRRIALVGLGWAMLPGCGLTPRNRLENCHRQSQALQIQLSQLKDETLALRAKNQELAQRAVEDAKRLRALEQSTRQAERGLESYRRERDELIAAFEQFKRLVQASAEAPRTVRASRERFESFAAAHPDCHFDAERGLWRFPASKLFAPGSAELSREGELLVGALGRVMADPSGPVAPRRVVAVGGLPPVQVASGGAGAEPTELARKRAEAVRDRLAGVLQVETAAIAADAGPTRPEAGEVRLAGAGEENSRRAEDQAIEIEFP